MRTKKTILSSLALGAALFLGGCSQPAKQEAVPSTTRVNAMVADWERAKKFTQAYLDSADDKTITFKLSDKTPRTFGGQLLHLAEANYGLVKPGAGAPSDIGFGSLDGKPEYVTKEAVSAAVNASYDYVIGALKTMNDTQLMDTVSVELFPGFKVSMTKEGYFNKAFEHQTHHRGQATQYLRAQGKTPPQEMLF